MTEGTGVDTAGSPRWRCRTCGREFTGPRSEHGCVKPADIDEYISAQPESVRPVLRQVRATIHAAVPDAVERIAWRMPTFRRGKRLIHFAAFKHHLGLYPGDVSLIPFQDRLAGHPLGRGTVQFPYDQPVDYDLIADIARWRLAAVANA